MVVVIYTGNMKFDQEMTCELYLDDQHLRGQYHHSIPVVHLAQDYPDSIMQVSIQVAPGYKDQNNTMVNVWVRSNKFPAWKLLRINPNVDTREGNLIVTADGLNPDDAWAQFQFKKQFHKGFVLKCKGDGQFMQRSYFLSYGNVMGSRVLTAKMTTENDYTILLRGHYN